MYPLWLWEIWENWAQISPAVIKTMELPNELDQRWDVFIVIKYGSSKKLAKCWTFFRLPGGPVYKHQQSLPLVIKKGTLRNAQDTSSSTDRVLANKQVMVQPWTISWAHIAPAMRTLRYNKEVLVPLTNSCLILDEEHGAHSRLIWINWHWWT